MSQIGYAEPKRLVLGVGDLYLDDVFVGNLKGTVTLTVTPTYAYQKPGNSLADLKAERTSMEVMLTASVCDLKPAQLRKALGVNVAIVSGTTNGTIRKQEVLKLSATANISLAETAVAGTMKVTKLDRSTAFVSSTDYSATSTTVTRKSGGAITAAQYVIVEYDFLDTGANAVLLGSEKTTPNTFRMEFVVEQSNGKRIMVTFYKAVVNTDLSMAFSDHASGTFTTHNLRLKALVDTTKVEGANLGEIVFEDDAA